MSKQLLCRSQILFSTLRKTFEPCICGVYVVWHSHVISPYDIFSLKYVIVTNIFVEFVTNIFVEFVTNIFVDFCDKYTCKICDKYEVCVALTCISPGTRSSAPEIFILPSVLCLILS